MYDYGKPFLLCVDDDPDILRQLAVFLGDEYNLVTAADGRQALQVLESIKPSVILLDIMMPVMDGYQVCSLLQDNPDTAWIPVIFISALGEEQDRARAFAAGAVDYLVKPVNRQTVRDLVKKHQSTGKRWAETKKLVVNSGGNPRSSKTVQEYICTELQLTGEIGEKMAAAQDWEIYAVASELGVSSVAIAEALAQYKGVPYIEFLSLDSIKLGALPTPFSKANNALVINHLGRDTLVLSNPFDLMLLDSLGAVLDPQVLANIAVTDPGNISLFFAKEQAPYLADRIIDLAIRRRVSEIRILPSEQKYAVAFVEKGSLSELTTLRYSLGVQLIARFKVFAGIASGNMNRTREGMYTHPVGRKACSLRLTLMPMPSGDSLTIRIIDVFGL